MLHRLCLYPGRFIITYPFQASQDIRMQGQRFKGELLCKLRSLMLIMFLATLLHLLLLFDLIFIIKQSLLLKVETHLIIIIQSISQYPHLRINPQIDKIEICISILEVNQSLVIDQQSIINCSQMSNENQSCNSIKLQQQNDKLMSQEPCSQLQQKSQQIINKKRIHRKQQISNFIIKTYKILEEKKNSHIIEWTDNGNCFIVKNKELFENQILPKYFKHKKFSSFVRQLNMYDFHKIRKEKEIPIFKHKFFKMSCYDLLHKIKRKSGEDDQTVKNMQSLPEISLKTEEIPLKSAYSIKSKVFQNINEEIEMLANQNSELKTNIADMNKEIMQLELSKVKKQQKLIKILSALIYFDIKNPIDNIEDRYSLRQLQNHFLNQQQPLSFLDYARNLGFIYRQIYSQFL